MCAFFLLSDPPCDVDLRETFSSIPSNEDPTFTVQSQKEMLVDKTLLSAWEYISN